MKKGLLMTSALIAAGMLTLGDDAQAQTKPANAVQLRLGGYMTQLFGVALNRPDTGQRRTTTGVVALDGAPNSFDVQTEAEVHFIGDGRLDNGLVIRAVAELELTGSPGQTWDEAYLILRNGFGQLILGNEDPVAELMTAGYGNGLVAHAGESMTYGSQNWVPVPPGMAGSPTLSAARSAFIESPDNNDSTKVIYVSPRFFGFQAGVSYAPEYRNQLGQGDSSAGAAGLTGNVDAGKRLPLKDAVHDMWSAGLNYDSLQIGSAKIGLAVGYVQAAKPHMSFGSGGPGVNASDAKQWGGGARVDIGGLRVLAGYKRSVNIENAPPGGVSQGAGAGVPGSFGGLICGAGGTGNCSVDGYGINAGAMYRWGANAVSLNGRYGTEAGMKAAGETDSDTVKTAIVSYARTLAPGVKATANYIWASYNNENSDIGATAADYSGSAIVGTINLRF